MKQNALRLPRISEHAQTVVVERREFERLLTAAGMMDLHEDDGGAAEPEVPRLRPTCSEYDEMERIWHRLSANERRSLLLFLRHILGEAPDAPGRPGSS